MLKNIGTAELLIILFLLVLFFGGKKIPDLVRGLGEGLREFRKGVSDDDGKDEDKKE